MVEMARPYVQNFGNAGNYSAKMTTRHACLETVIICMHPLIDFIKRECGISYTGGSC